MCQGGSATVHKEGRSHHQRRSKDPAKFPHVDRSARSYPALSFLLGPRLRKRRRQLGLTLRELCERAGLSVGYLSQVENDKAVPTLGTLAQIAAGLEVGLDYFVAQPRPADALSRAEGRPRFSLPGSPVAYEAISSDYPGSELSSYILHVPPGYASETVTHEGEEIVVILNGEIEQRLGAEVITMRAGDSLHYSGAPLRPNFKWRPDMVFAPRNDQPPANVIAQSNLDQLLRLRADLDGPEGAAASQPRAQRGGPDQRRPDGLDLDVPDRNGTGAPGDAGVYGGGGYRLGPGVGPDAGRGGAHWARGRTVHRLDRPGWAHASADARGRGVVREHPGLRCAKGVAATSPAPRGAEHDALQPLSFQGRPLRI